MRFLKAFFSVIIFSTGLLSQETSEQDAFSITNVRVVEASGDSITILWYTTTQTSDNRVIYGTAPPLSQRVSQNTAESGATQLHSVTIGGMEPRTTYFFYVESDGVTADNQGNYFTYVSPRGQSPYTVDTYFSADSDDNWFLTFQVTDSRTGHFINTRDTSLRSLETRFFMHGTQEQMQTITAQIAESRYGDFELFYTTLKDVFGVIGPEKIEDSYDPSDNSYSWYFSLPIGEALHQYFQAGGTVQSPIELVINGVNMQELPDQNHWSFREHRQADGDPFDFSITTPGSSSSIANPYVTLQQDDQILWGTSPTDTAHLVPIEYAMISQITSPIVNPPQDTLMLESSPGRLVIEGWAKINMNGTIDDIWINGKSIDEVTGTVRYDNIQDRFVFSLNEALTEHETRFDITVFAGPAPGCHTCSGSAFYNHQFTVLVKNVEKRPAQMSLFVNGESISSYTVTPDTAVQYLLRIQDPNANRDTGKIEYVFATVSISESTTVTIPLRESSTSDDIFLSTETFSFVPDSVASSERKLPVKNLDAVIIRYTDPTDPTDSCAITLHVEEIFEPYDPPRVVSGSIFDLDGDGRADRVTLSCFGTLDNTIDSIILPFPTTRNKSVFGPSSFELTDFMLTINDSFQTENSTFFSSENGGKGILLATYRNQPIVSEFEILDKMGPVITAATFYETENSDGDSMVVTFSEEVTGVDWVSFMLVGNGTQSRLSISDVRRIGENTFVLRGDFFPDPHAALRFAADAAVTDLSGNGPHHDNRPAGITIIPAPAYIVSGAYYDTDANGIVDKLSLKCTKPVSVDSLIRVHVQWHMKRYSVPAAQVSKAGDSTLAVSLSGIIGNYATSGAMNVSLEYVGHGESMQHSVVDSAAPIILSAAYLPQNLSSGNHSGNRLEVVFSESVDPTKIAYPTPFHTHKQADSSRYALHLSHSGTYEDGNSITFSVTDFELYPTTGDLIRVAPGGGISDTAGNIQNNPQNKSSRLVSKPYALSFKAAPNPFNPADLFAAPLTSVSTPPGIAVVCDFNAFLGSWASRISAKIIIYDCLGNVIGRSKSHGDSRPPIQYTFIQSPRTQAIFTWSGRSSNGRMVGPGTYLAIISVTDPSGSTVTERIALGVKME